MMVSPLATLLIAGCLSLFAFADGEALAGQPDEQAAPQTAQQRHQAFEEEWSEDITPQTNAARHLFVYMTAPEFRDDAYADELIELGIDLPADEVPYFMEWFTYHYGVLDEEREAGQQFQLTTRSEPIDPEAIPEVLRWLEIVGPSMDAMHEAAGKPHFWVSHHVPDEEAYTYLKGVFSVANYAAGPARALIQAYDLRARYYLATEAYDLAVADLIAADRLNKLLCQLMDLGELERSYSESSRMDYVLSQFLESNTLTDGQLAKIAEQWERPYDGFTAYQILDQWERLWLIDYFERVESGAEEEPSFYLGQILSMGYPVDDEELEGWDWMITHDLFDTQRAIDQVNARYDALIGSLEADDFTSLQDQLAQADQAMREYMGRMEWSIEFVESIYKGRSITEGVQSDDYTDRIVDVMMILVMHPNRVLDASMEEYNRDAGQAVGTTAIALSRYRLKHQAYPDAFADLVPEYLDAVTGDPYLDGQPLRYSRSGNRQTCRILSVGTDQEDNQGEGYNDIYIDLD